MFYGITINKTIYTSTSKTSFDYKLHYEKFDYSLKFKELIENSLNYLCKSCFCTA